MEDTIHLVSTLQLFLSILLLVLFLAVVGVVVLRFKSTAAGVLIGTAYGGFALLILVSWLLFRVILTNGSRESAMMAGVVLDGLDVLSTLILAVGIGFIPKALRRSKRPPVDVR